MNVCRKSFPFSSGGKRGYQRVPHITHLRLVVLVLSPPLFFPLCRQAYRELAKIHHPDKVQGDEEKIKSEKIFQEVAEAYEVLGDDELRAK